MDTDPIRIVVRGAYGTSDYYDRTKDHFVADIGRAALVRFSRHDRLLAHPQNEHFRVSGNATAIKHVTDWIHEQSTKADTDVLTLQHIPSFEENVYIHEACATLKLRPSVRGDDLRDALVHYIKMAPLKMSEFAMICEMAGFDCGLVKLTLQSTRGFCRELRQGNGCGVLEWNEIVQYCHEHRVEGFP